MAFPDHNWTITHNSNKSYTVSCSGFIEKTKSITLVTTNRNFTGDVNINITCANCGTKSMSGIASIEAVTVDTTASISTIYNVYTSGTMRLNIAESGWIQKGNYDLSYASYKVGTISKGKSLTLTGTDTNADVTLTSTGASSNGYLSVRQNASITISGANTAYYTDSSINRSYSVNTFKVGEVPLSWFISPVYINSNRLGGSGNQDSRIEVTLYPDSIYVVLNDGTDFYSAASGSLKNTVIWSETNSWAGGSIVWFEDGYWYIISHDYPINSSKKAHCQPNLSDNARLCYLDGSNYIRRVRIANKIYCGSSVVNETGSGNGTRIKATITSY